MAFQRNRVPKIISSHARSALTTLVAGSKCSGPSGLRPAATFSTPLALLPLAAEGDFAQELVLVATATSEKTTSTAAQRTRRWRCRRRGAV